jgi:hypothetical protein
MTTAVGIQPSWPAVDSPAERLAVAHESEGHGQAHKAAAPAPDLIDGEESPHVIDDHPNASGHGLSWRSGRGLFDGQPGTCPTRHPRAAATSSSSPAAPATQQAAQSTKPMAKPHKHAKKHHKHKHKPASQPAAQPSSQPAPPPASQSAAPPNPIPQGNGGDHDADNNGGPSDGDGNI